MAIKEMVPHAYRREEDALGGVQVPAEHLWGEQTQQLIEVYGVGRLDPHGAATRRMNATNRPAEIVKKP